MTEKPWLTDPQFGGMSPESARLSYEAWARQGFRVSPVPPRGVSNEEGARLIRGLEAQVADIEQAQAAAIAWSKDWRGRQRGFRAARRAAQR